MNTVQLFSKRKDFVELTKNESRAVDGGNLSITPQFFAISAFTGAAMCIFEFGKATGNFIYQVTH